MATEKVLTPFADNGCGKCKGRGEIAILNPTPTAPGAMLEGFEVIGSDRLTFEPCACRYEEAYGDKSNRKGQVEGWMSKRAAAQIVRVA